MHACLPGLPPQTPDNMSSATAHSMGAMHTPGMPFPDVHHAPPAAPAPLMNGASDFTPTRSQPSWDGRVPNAATGGLQPAGSEGARGSWLGLGFFFKQRPKKRVRNALL